MSLLRGTNLAGWSGDAGLFQKRDSPSQFIDGFKQDEHLRLIAILNQLATVPTYQTGRPKLSNDSVDTAGLGRPFRAGALWTDSVTKNMWVCTSHAQGVAGWANLSGITEVSSSCSSSSSSVNSSSSTSSVNSSSSTSSVNSSSCSSVNSSSSCSSSSVNSCSSESTMSSSSTSSVNSSSSTSSVNSSSSSSLNSSSSSSP